MKYFGVLILCLFIINMVYIEISAGPATTERKQDVVVITLNDTQLQGRVIDICFNETCVTEEIE